MKRESCLTCKGDVDVCEEIVMCPDCASIMRVLSWEPLTLQTIKDSPSQVAQVDYQSETVELNDGSRYFISSQIREINISKQARALWFLRFADYMLIILCGSLLIDTLATIVREPESILSEGLLLFLLVVVLVLSFSIITGYRHIGVIDASVWWSFIISFPLLILLFIFIARDLALILSEIGLMPSSRTEKEIAMSALVYLSVSLWIITVSFVGLVAVLLLRRMRIKPLGTTLIKLLSYLKRHRNFQAQRLKRLKRVNAPRGFMYAAFSTSIFLILIFILTSDMWPLSFLAFFLLIKARRDFQVSADSLLSADRRNPILFLRSFADDVRLKFGDREKALIDFSLETRLSNHFRKFGPFIAIGSPRDLVPQLGAARITLPEHEWQPKVLGWISDASLIIMYSGKSDWVNWELKQIIEQQQVARLILLVPEVKGSKSYRAQEVVTRIEHVQEVFKNTKWSRSLAELYAHHDLRAILFIYNGSIVTIRSRPHNRDSYHLAALIAHYIKLNPAAASVVMRPSQNTS